MNNVFRRWVLFMLFSVCGAFSALSFAETKPEFSQATSAKWYYVKFKAGGMYLTGHGPGKPLTVESFQGSNDQKWMLSGDEKNFSMTTRSNYNLALRDGAWNEKVNNCPAVGDAVDKEYFQLHLSTLRSYAGSYEIESHSYPQKSLNTWGGTAAGTPVGVWYLDDSNNAVEFVPVDQAPFQVIGIENYQPAEKNTLWYDAPADNGLSTNAWMEYSLPIGNGQLGASVFGGVKNDEIIFNEKTLWTGTSTSVGTDGNSNEYGSFQVFGAIRIEDQNALGQVTNYLRDLNLATATASMSYTHAGSDYKREYIVSYPDKVVATRLSVANGNGKINIKVSLDPRMQKSGIQTTYQNGEAHFAGKLDVVSFDARMKIVAEGGEVVTNSHDITVVNASEVLIVLAGGTDFDNSKPNFVWGTDGLLSEMDRRVDQAAVKKWKGLYDAHLKDYKRFYDRVKLNFTGAENAMPTNQLVDEYQRGHATNTLMLEQLYFHYGRYLEIASSRGVNLPSNLQGIWTNNNKAAWNADIHANINVQMNYWPAETANMSEMHEPFLNYIIEMADSEPWLRYAKAANPKGRGWTCYTENNIFGGVGVWAHNYVIVNAWYCSHLWQHYRYTLNEDFLEKAFPAMLSAAQFWMDRLILKDGKYVCPAEYSPEHGPKKEDGVAHAQQLVWELFDNTLKAVKVLGPQRSKISQEDLDMLNERFQLLDPGLGIETYQGIWGNINGVTAGTPILREWMKSSYDAGENGHRHMSHLMCLYPFSQVKQGSDLFNAAVNSLKLRGDQSTGWSMGWKINLWARAMDGNHAHDILRLALRHSTSYEMVESAGGIYYNLFDSHAPFQIDGNFGACAGITEMLFQSHDDVLHFLPALPDAWANGAVSGLKGIGGFMVGVDWTNGRAQKLTILNVKGQKCLVKCTRADKAINEALVTVNQVAVAPKATEQPGVFEIPSVNENDEIVIDFTQGSGVVPQPDPVYEGTCGEQLQWQLAKSTGVLTISGTGAMYDYTEQEPAPWAAVAHEVKSIVLPTSDVFTHVGARAFIDCNKVRRVLFNDNALTIGKDAFALTTDTRLIINDADYAEKQFPLNENTYNTIEYNRTIGDGKWATIILPFSLNTETAYDYHFYELSSATDHVVTFKFVRFPLANVPYMYKNANGISASQMISDRRTTIKSDAPCIKDAGAWSMLGSYDIKKISGTDLANSYVLSGGKIMNSSTSLKIRTFRAYFKGPRFEDLTSKVLRIVIEEEDGETTDITDVLVDEAKDNGAIFDLSGRQVWQTVPGHIYIKNGQKFLAK